MSARIDELLKQVAALSSKDRRELLQRLQEGEQQGTGDITQLEGLGKEIWAGIDPQKYVDEERDSWDHSND